MQCISIHVGNVIWANLQATSSRQFSSRKFIQISVFSFFGGSELHPVQLVASKMPVKIVLCDIALNEPMTWSCDASAFKHAESMRRKNPQSCTLLKTRVLKLRVVVTEKNKSTLTVQLTEQNLKL